MGTGDIKNNMRKLQNELKLIHFTEEIDFEKILIGLSAPLLPILHHVFTEYSCDLSSYFSARGYDLYAKSDFRFLEIIYKILVQEFETKPMLTKQQFFSIGYSEIKVIFTTKIVSLCRKKNESLVKKLAKKKKVTVPMKRTCNNEEKVNNISSEEKEPNFISDMQLGSIVTPSLSSENTQETESVYVPVTLQNTVRSKHRIKAPEPNPELALSPVKSNEQSVKYHKNDDDRIIDSNLLDLTDIGEESFMETNEVEVVDPDEEKSTCLPQFKITKHSNSGKHVKAKTDDWTLSNIIGTRVHYESYEEPSMVNLSGHSLPGNISVALSKRSDQARQCQECEQCHTNGNAIRTLVEKVGAMENQILNLVNVNNDLSAKVVLMETKVKLMESFANKKFANGDNTCGNEDLTNVRDATSEYTNFDGGNIDFNQRKGSCSSSIPANNYVYTDTVTADAATISTNIEKSYSPIKYTDDDIIIKDFKPIRMKDVYNMMNEVVLNDSKENVDPCQSQKVSKENVASCQPKKVSKENVDPCQPKKVSKENVDPCQPKKVMERKEVFKMQVIDDTSQGNLIAENHDNHSEVDDTLSDPCNISMLFDDDVTAQAVQNVRKKLQETEDMLRNSGNYVVR